jgi:drug/metabolite transporter (DMT)-like permease
MNAVIFAAIMRVVRPGIVKRVDCQDWRLAPGGGGASLLAYAMVTWVVTVAPLPLVTALRETSSVFALLLGVFVLKERLDPMKALATMCTMRGVGLLRVNR